jgi:hypothetical protein
VQWCWEVGPRDRAQGPHEWIIVIITGVG